MPHVWKYDSHGHTSTGLQFRILDTAASWVGVAIACPVGGQHAVHCKQGLDRVPGQVLQTT